MVEFDDETKDQVIDFAKNIAFRFAKSAGRSFG
jgi:hypothetical protein